MTTNGKEDIYDTNPFADAAAWDLGTDSELLDHAMANWAEDDPMLKRELEEEEVAESDVPDEHPYNDTALNVTILNRRENEERMESGEYEMQLLEIKNDERVEHDDGNKAAELEKEIAVVPEDSDPSLFKEEALTPKKVEQPNIITSENPVAVPAIQQWEPELYLPTKEPDYPALSVAAWVLATAIVSGIVGLIFPLAFILTGIATWLWISALNDQNYWNEREAKKIFRINREKERVEREKIQRKNQQEAYRQRNATEYARRQEVRRMIENMPEYQMWRKRILERDGRRCVVCGSTENLEVDHRYESLDSIIWRHNITTKIEAYACRVLWDINNGAVICKGCHDQTASSRYRASKL